MTNILITGCRGGIGLNVAKRLLNKGHTVYATVHRKESIKNTKKELKKYGNLAIVEKLDILLESDRKKVEKWDIDVLINNAAIGDSGPLLEIPIDRVKSVFETNIFSALKLTQRAAKKMIKNKKGKIIFISSVAAFIPTPYLSPYAMTKSALENIISSLRNELKPFNIPVVAINPGAYNTGFNQKNIKKKYEWMKKNSLYKNHMDKIKKTEERLLTAEIQSTDSIAKKITKAVISKNPKKRYYAPWWHYIGSRFLR